MKRLLILTIAGILIIGCIEKPSENIPNEKNVSEKEWYLYTYVGPSNMENSENARMAVIPYLRELGWDGGINVVYGTNDSIIILLPFQLIDKSMNQVNQTLSNFSFNPLRLNEKIVLNRT